MISTVTLAVVASGTSTRTSGSAGTGTSTVPASTRTRTPATWTPRGRTAHRAQRDLSHLDRLVQADRDRLADRPAPKSPVIQGVRRSPSKACSGLPNGDAVSSEPDPVAVTEPAPSSRVTVWVSGSPNRVRVDEGSGWSARRVGE